MGNLRMNADQISYKGGEKPMSVEQAIKNAGNVGLAHTADIAPDFSTEAAYSARDMVYYNGSLYEFTEDHAAGAWSSEDTQPVTVGEVIKNADGGLPSYSTTEQKTGQKWIDGNDIYFKTEVLENTIQLNPSSWTTVLQASYMTKLLFVMTVGGDGTVTDGRIRWHLENGEVQAAAYEILNLINPTITLYYTKA